MKFHLHDSASRKSSEYFRKIKEAIINRINLQFDNPIEIGESLKMENKFVFENPKIKSSTSDDAGIRAQENLMFMEEHTINFTIFNQSAVTARENCAWPSKKFQIWNL